MLQGSPRRQWRDKLKLVGSGGDRIASRVQINAHVGRERIGTRPQCAIGAPRVEMGGRFRAIVTLNTGSASSVHADI